MIDDELRQRLHVALEKLGRYVETVIPPTTEDYFVVLLTDTDRGCILSIAESLNFLLERKIRQKLKALSRASKSDLDFLLSDKPLPPIGSFGVRIVAARALGIITPEAKGALKKVKNLRNDQAHSFMGVSISEEQVNRIVDSMGKKSADLIRSDAENLLEVSATLRQEGHSSERIESPARRLLISLFVHLVLQIVLPLPKA